MNTSRPEYLEAFVKQCYDAGLDEESTALLHHTAHTLELLESNPDYRAGFEVEMNKRAFGDPTSTTGQMTSFADPGAVGSTVGGAGGFVGGAIAGAKLLPRILRGVPRIGAIPKVLGLVGGLGGMWGGSAIGRSAMTPGAGASPSQTFIPPYMRGGSGTSSAGSGSSDISEHHSSPLDVLSPSTGAASPGRGIGMEPGMRGNIAAQGNQLKSINDQIVKLHQQAAGASSTPGLQGSLQGRQIQQQIEQLNSQKSKLLYDYNSLSGQLHRDQNRSISSIDAATEQNQHALADRSGRAQAMDNWFRSHPNGGLAYKAFNWLTGADQKAQGLLSEQQALEEQNRQLAEQRRGVQGMTTPLM